MKLCFNEATAKGSSSLEKDIMLCAAAGFEYIELRFDMIYDYLQEHTPGDIRALLKQYGILPHALNACYTYADLFGEKDEPERNEAFLDKFIAACSLAEKLEAHYIIVVPPMNPEGFAVPYKRDREQAGKDFARIVGRLSQTAQEYRVKLCLEPVGAPKSSIRTVKQMNEVIQKVNRENVGIVLDAYNLYMAYMDSRYEEISCLDPEKIFAVHINNADAAGPSLEARRFCDEGVIDLGAFLGQIKAKGYEGMVSIETFRPEYWERQPEEIIPLAYETTRQALLEHGCI